VGPLPLWTQSLSSLTTIELDVQIEPEVVTVD